MVSTNCVRIETLYDSSPNQQDNYFQYLGLQNLVLHSTSIHSISNIL